MQRKRFYAWILILIVDAGLLAWGLMAVAWPDHLLGPAGRPIPEYRRHRVRSA